MKMIPQPPKVLHDNAQTCVEEIMRITLEQAVKEDTLITQEVEAVMSTLAYRSILIGITFAYMYRDMIKKHAEAVDWITTVDKSSFVPKTPPKDKKV